MSALLNCIEEKIAVALQPRAICAIQKIAIKEIFSVKDVDE